MISPWMMILARGDLDCSDRPHLLFGRALGADHQSTCWYSCHVTWSLDWPCVRASIIGAIKRLNAEVDERGEER